MSKERELLESCLDEMQYHSLVCPELKFEIQELLAQPEQELVNFDLERMKLAVESPVSDVTVEGLIDKVKSNREHIVDVTDMVEPVEDRIARWHKLGYEQGKKASQREPLSDKHLQQLCERERFTYSISQQLFNAVARRIEKEHGITGGEG